LRIKVFQLLANKFRQARLIIDNEYLYNIHSSIVCDFEVLELIDEDSVKLIKLKAVLKEDCLLYITELHTKNFQKYSYHCQKNDGDLIAGNAKNCDLEEISKEGMLMR